MIDGKPFTDTLGELEQGQVLRDLTARQREIVEAVLETVKKGSLTITLEYTPTGRGSVEIDVKIKPNVPEHGRPSTTFFATPDNTLVRDDPKQPKLPLHRVDTPSNDPIHVPDRR